MKTLDEVIKAFSEVNKEVGCGDCQFNDAESDDIPCELNDCIFNDALFYLKEHQKVNSNYWSEKAISELNNIADAYFLRAYREDKDELTALHAYRKEQQENAPLTWDELKQMKGRPMWIESQSLSVGTCPYWKDWYIIKSFSDDEFMYCNDGFEWAKETQGRLWQAYMKERK